MKKTILISVITISLTAIIIAAMGYIFHKRNNQNVITLFGNVDVRQVDISFRVSGRVNELMFEEGDHVKAGELMCTLEQNPYDSQLEEAKANVQALQVQLENANTLLNRRMELITIGAVSQEDLDNTKTTRDQLIANLQQAQGSLAVAHDNVSYTKSYAPTDGVILTRIREPGTVVNPTNPVYTLSISDPVWIRAFVDEPQLGLVYYGMEAEVFTDIKNGRIYKGKVGFISPVAEFTPKTVETTQLRTDLVYRLRIYVDNPDRHLVQGMPVTVNLRLKGEDRRD